jgi:hypothetical protein
MTTMYSKYNSSPSIDPQLLAASCHQEGDQTCKPLNTTAADRETDKDDFPALEEPYYPTMYKEDSIEKDSLQRNGQQTQLRIVNIDNSQGKCINSYCTIYQSSF